MAFGARLGRATVPFEDYADRAQTEALATPLGRRLFSVAVAVVTADVRLCRSTETYNNKKKTNRMSPVCKEIVEFNLF